MTKLIARKFRHSIDRATGSLKVLIDGDRATVVRTLPAGMDIGPHFWRNVSVTEAREIFKRQQEVNFSGNWEIVGTTEKTGEMHV